ncbi:MAG: glycosyltransferase family 2 protein [Planctomycetota bacterium]
MTTFDALFAVVVNWNGGADNLVCLRSLIELEGLPPERIVFVDNASRDGSRAAVAAAHPGLVFIDHTQNLGFGEGANAGARAALTRGAAAVVFVNNDLTFPGGTLRGLAAAFDAEPRLGIAGPLVLFRDPEGAPSRVWCAGGRLDHRQNLSTLLGHGAPVDDAWRRERAVDYVAGCALMASRALLSEVGLFDASYFAYHEDLELGLRARRAGFDVRTYGRLTAYHAPSSATGGGYSPRRKWMMGLNSVRFLRRYGGAAAWGRFVLFDVLTLPPLFALGLVNGRWRGVAAKALGIFDGARGRRVTASRLEAGSSWLW